MNKFPRRAIMKRSKLKNKSNKTKHPVDIKMYKKQNAQEKVRNSSKKRCNSYYI